MPLLPGDINAAPAAIVQAIDRQFREFEASNEWSRRVNRAVSGASLLGNALFATFTRKNFNDFRASARAPGSLPTALEDYVAFRFDRRESTIVLLVDEAQNLGDTTRVREHLLKLHDGIKGQTQVLLVCFGLANTANRLRELGPTALRQRLSGATHGRLPPRLAVPVVLLQGHPTQLGPRQRAVCTLTSKGIRVARSAPASR